MKRVAVLILLLWLCWMPCRSQVDTLYRVSASEFVRSLGRWRDWHDLEAYSVKKGLAMKEFMFRHNGDEEGLKFLKAGDAYYDSKSMLRMYALCSVEIQEDTVLLQKKKEWEAQLSTAEGLKYTDIPILYKGRHIHLSDMMGKGRHVILSFLPSGGVRENELILLRESEIKHTLDGIRFVQAEQEAFETYGVSHAPETIIIDRNGMISVRNLQGKYIEDAIAFHTEEKTDTVRGKSEASFPGGDAACRQFLREHLRYPEAARAAGKEGRVQLSFVVEPDGRLEEVAVTESPDEAMSQEALRLVKSMPRWQPACLWGEPYQSRAHLRISFGL